MPSVELFRAARPLDTAAPHYVREVAHEPDPKEPAALLTCPNRRCPVDTVSVRLHHLYKPESLLAYTCPECSRTLDFRVWQTSVHLAPVDGQQPCADFGGLKS